MEIKAPKCDPGKGIRCTLLALLLSASKERHGQLKLTRLTDLNTGKEHGHLSLIIYLPSVLWKQAGGAFVTLKFCPCCGVRFVP